MSVDLPSWNDTPARRAIVASSRGSSPRGGPAFVPVQERVAAFDNDGTLWCEKPMPVQLDFIVRRFAQMAAADPALRDRRPWKAAHEGDLGWLGGAMTKHLVYAPALDVFDEDALAAAAAEGWTVVSMKGDWSAVFPP